MTVDEAIQRLKTPGTSFSGCDWKYGFPHKVYIGHHKFYTVDGLRDAGPEQLAEFDALSRKIFGISFTRDSKGIRYRAPTTNSFYGWQLYGNIGPDGEPDHSRMEPGKPDMEVVAKILSAGDAAEERKDH